MFDIIELFNSGKGKSIYSEFLRAIELYGMRTKIEKGVLVGLSGGADSVTLLLLLLRYRLDTSDFPIVSSHINHGIRGAEADRDEEFSIALAKSIGVELFVKRIDCIKLRNELGGSLEEIARNERYSEFEGIIKSRNDINTVAVAHNADDNLETVIFNYMRGSGTAGVAGIPPVRDNIIRPLIFVRKSDIVSFLNENGIQYVTDSTNKDNDYSRNYIRNNIVPKLVEYFDNVYEMASRASYNLRIDNDYIDTVANNFLKKCNGTDAREIIHLHPAVRLRIIKMIAIDGGCRSIESTHIHKVDELLYKTNFSYSLPDGYQFICERGKCRVVKNNTSKTYFRVELTEEINNIAEFDATVVISDNNVAKISSIVYNFSIQADLSSAIIDSGIYIRNRMDGDSYFYGGMTHKLKKLFNDRKIPLSMRDKIPIFCDKRGILWVPGFGIRDDGVRSEKSASIFLYLKENGAEGSFYVPMRD